MDISIRTEVCRSVNFAMQQNYVPTVYSIIVTNNSDNAAENITLTVSAVPDYADSYSTLIPLISPHTSFEIRPVPFKARPEYLYSLTEKLTAQVVVEAQYNGVVVAQDRIDIELLAYDQWNGIDYVPEMISAYITPNHPDVTAIISRAGKYLQSWVGEPSFTGYQTNDPNNVRLQAAAIYSAIQELNIAYCVPPADYEATGQRVRLPSEVIGSRLGTCLDLALLYSSCLEAVSIHPMIVFMEKHAFAGLWLEEKSFSECAIDDRSAVLKRCADGINEICVVECTGAAAGKDISFEQAEKSAKDTLGGASKFELAIDVNRCRGGGIRPIPIRVNNNGVYELLPYAADDDRSYDSAAAPQKKLADGRIATQNNVPLTKLQMWERKLLDLSLRNSLLNFRAKKNSVQLMISDLSCLEDKLASGEAFTIMPQPDDWAQTVKDSSIFDVENDKDLIASISEAEFKNNRIRTFISETELNKCCKSLYNAARTSLFENGSNTLYLALGFLRWYESDKSEKARYAPLVLVPVDIIRNVQSNTYKIRVRDEETQMNITLLELLRQDLGIDITGLDPLPTDEKGVDIQMVFNTVRHAVLEQKRWDIESYAFIGLFSFSQFIMWNDLRNRSEEITSNKVVSSLISGKLEWEPEFGGITEDMLDERIKPADLAIAGSADSSQMIAIELAAEGQSFVLHGPPGTGKSQTITNMIANALYHDKTVLFVAKKMAALSVVQSRLEKIGLGAFCLELHSNKAQKRAVLSQLERTMDIGRIASPEKYKETADKLYALRCQLNDVMNAIHKSRKIGLSVYETVALYEKNSEHKGKIDITKQQAANIDGNMFEKLKEAVISLKSIAAQFGTVGDHALKGYGRRDYSITIRDKLSNDLVKGEKLLSDLKNSYAKICALLSVNEEYGRDECDEIYSLCDIALNCPTLLLNVLNGSADTMITDRLSELISDGNELSALDGEILQIFDNTVFGYDAEQAKLEWKKASSSWFLAKNIGRNKLVKELRLHAKNADSISKDNYPDFVDKLIKRSQLYRSVTNAEPRVADAAKEIWLSENTDWELAESILKSNTSAAQILKSRDISVESFVALKNNSDDVRAFIDSYKTFCEHYGTFCSDFCVEQDNSVWLSECEKRYVNWQLYIDRIKEWSELLRAMDAVEELGFPQICDALNNNKVSSEDIVESVLCAVGYQVSVYQIETDSVLANFGGRSFEDTIAKFSDVTEQFRELTINELVAKLSAKVPLVSGQMASSSEIGILLKVIKSGGRLMPIRKLFDSISLLLHRICPCMLMSPISVAQYIDPNFPKFDLVIFDEASQLQTCEAVGAIARGENVVVVGDPKQLPPTSFFTVNHVEEDNFEKEDLESVLDDCLAVSMPQKHLLWHYRSRHESLIAYSNSRYYDNKLYTFPSPNDMESKVTLVKVEGYYDKGGSKQNKAEAEAIVKEIERRLDDEQLRQESIGIVTFSVVQQSLIDDMLADKFRERPELEKLADEMYEPLFIKNLENVQGDERDVILFSVGYGPDKNGKVSMNFGPINRDGGWRRLNVAISRARKCMTVFSTITYDMIDMSRTSSEGVAGLKGFLEFAEKGKSALATRSSGAQNSEYAIEKLIAEEINKAGYSTRCNIGCSEYKMDIGVIDPDDPDVYMLGIMCDGYSYKMAKTAYDRNLSQTSVLQGLGWNIIRVWTLDWFDSKEKVMSRVLSAIAAVQEGKNINNDVKKADISISSEDFAKETVSDESSDRVKVYEEFVPKAVSSPDDFYSPGFAPMVKKTMKDVINALAPISRKTLFKLTMSAFGLTRGSSKSDNYLTDILGSLDCVITKSNNSAFIWSESVTPDSMTYFRRPQNGKRPLDDICAEEIANAAMYVIERQLTVTRTDLTREVAKCFGYTRTTPAMENAITEGIVLCKSRGYIEISPESGKISVK